MEVSSIIAEIDAQISKLQQARALLSETSVEPVVAHAKRGRPKGSKNSATKAAAVVAPKASTKTSAKASSKAAKPGPKPGPKPAPEAAAKKSSPRKLSPEGRKRIADAMKKRWAERKKVQ